MVERPVCVLPEEGCGHLWYVGYDNQWMTTSVQHGDNPEHTRDFPDSVRMSGHICRWGHLVEVETWIRDVVACCVPQEITS